MYYERKSQHDVCAADNEVFLVIYVDSLVAQQQDCDGTCDVCQVPKMMLSCNHFVYVRKTMTRHSLIPIPRKWTETWSWCTIHCDCILLELRL
jgi:hypothetical protein